jgi:DNA-binding NarL/FixJ family response regulator
MRYLIVDDNEQIRSYIKSTILKRGDECRELSDASFVNDVYHEFRPHWVLLDLQMAPMNGFAAAVRLKHDFPKARFVFVTNYDDKRYRKKAQELGAAALVSKENLTELINVLSG